LRQELLTVQKESRELKKQVDDLKKKIEVLETRPSEKGR
jgi:hypothetical protein